MYNWARKARDLSKWLELEAKEESWISGTSVWRPLTLCVSVGKPLSVVRIDTSPRAFRRTDWNSNPMGALCGLGQRKSVAYWKWHIKLSIVQCSVFITLTPNWCYLFIFVGKVSVVFVRIFVDDLRYSYYVVVGVSHSHAKQWLRVVTSNPVNLVVKPGVLKKILYLIYFVNY